MSAPFGWLVLLAPLCAFSEELTLSLPFPSRFAAGPLGGLWGPFASSWKIHGLILQRAQSFAVGRLQAKWVKGSGKTEKSFIGGESFQGFGAGDGVEAVLDKDDFR